MHTYEKISGLCVFVLLLLVTPATQSDIYKALEQAYPEPEAA